MTTLQRGLSLLLATAVLTISPGALAWGVEGHKIVALIAQQEMTPAARKAVNALLATDTDDLTAHDIASESVWADAWRDSGGDLDVRGYHRTAQWHYIDLELRHPNFSYACWHQQPLPASELASQGPWHDCVVDKIDQFEDELAAQRTPAPERLLALKFLLHLVGDLHQPLHAADDHDHGGNNEKVSGLGNHLQRLHHAWDSTFVRDLGRDPQTVAAQLVAHITPQMKREWALGTSKDWAWETYRIAQSQVYGKLPSSNHHRVEHLNRAYIDNADNVVAQQLSKAGVRLAWLLDRALAPQH